MDRRLSCCESHVRSKVMRAHHRAFRRLLALWKTLTWTACWAAGPLDSSSLHAVHFRPFQDTNRGDEEVRRGRGPTGLGWLHQGRVDRIHIIQWILWKAEKGIATLLSNQPALGSMYLLAGARNNLL